ncbi:50S ribosomal protein L9 [Facilibium subflavum]|uniref:50S ribosomal protein L9 n=1 Tax=Facilibium subflavum TaxID=2219058 RepID=UPI000E65529F|nr:50S ribosomal protein L9 [Facilibium subflavum]
MQVILREKVENLGTLGDIVNVKPGYARNYLVPYGKAVQATKENIEVFEQQKAELEKAEAKRLQDAKATAEKISDQTFVIKAQAGEGGKLFGSVGTKEIVDVLASAASVQVEKRHVRMPEGSIRYVGQFQITIQLHTDVETEINVAVEAE